MGKTLVIAEKPSVARDLVAALGSGFKKTDSYFESDDWVVTYAVGHLVRLADPEEYDEGLKKWRLEDLPIVPDKFKLKAQDQTRDQLVAIHKLVQRPDIERVINACDAGREGELIFAYIYDITSAQKPVERLWISSMTKEAIAQGFAALRPGLEMQPLAAAARSRSEADWLVGMNATRAATVRARGLFDGVVSLGRVQTPTLAMIVRRDLEIEKFKSHGYFVIKATFDAAAGKYGGLWFRGDERRLGDETEAQAIADKVRGQAATIAAVEKNEALERPPLLYDLTSLQRDANTRFGFSADQTLKLAQSLYETRKALTYPRTDSRFLPSDMKPQLKKTARTLEGHGYDDAVQYVLGLTDFPGRIVDDKKVSDHHAIIPSLASHDPAHWSDEEKMVFDLVARRFLAVFHPPAKYEKTRIVTLCEGEQFRTTGSVTLEPGWRAVYGDQAAAEDEKKSPDEDEVGELPTLVKDEAVTCQEAASEKKETKPPKRYNESSLLAAMETAGKQVEDEEMREAMKAGGLGTPATRASTIERLLHVGYLERKGKQLLATDKGIQVIEMLGEHPLTSAELTGSWEKRLSDIEKGELSREDFMADVGRFAGETVVLITTMDNEIVGAPLEDDIGLCPRCGQKVKETPKAFSCSSWQSQEDPGCGFVLWKEVAGKRLRAEVARELIEKGRTAAPIEGFKAKSGNDFAAHLVLGEDGKVNFDFPERAEVAADADEAIATCPNCGKGVVETAKSYACSSWKSKEEPGCGFGIWKEIAKRPITSDEFLTLIKEGKTPVLSGFKNKEDHPFAAALVLGADGKVVFDFPPQVEVAADAEGSLGGCPECGKGVVETPRAYSCSSWKSKEEPGCGFVLWKEVAKRKITLPEAIALVKGGRTEVLHGFKSNKGAKFSASLVLEPGEDGKLKAGFDFPPERVVAADSESAVGKCPLCGQGVVEKAKSYSCSSWKSRDEPGCGFVIWKEIAKKKIGAGVVKQLLEKGRTPKPLAGFKSKKGSDFNAYLVLDRDKKVVFEFDDDARPAEEFTEVTPLGKCPRCQKDVFETARAFSCSSYQSKDEPGCGFAIWKEVAKKELNSEAATQLLERGRTEMIDGFVGKSGKAFSAMLLLGEDGKVTFEFPKDEKSSARAVTTAGGLIDESGAPSPAPPPSELDESSLEESPFAPGA